MNQLENRIRLWLIVFVIGLLVSGVTAFPLVWEVNVLHGWLGSGSALGTAMPALAAWIDHVQAGLNDVQVRYPFLFYGTDWLAFAHIVIAIAFIGPLRDPVRNVWVVEFGLIACALVLPLALIAGPVRGIPVFWQIVDCSFGVFGAVPLWLVRRDIRALEAAGRARPPELTRVAAPQPLHSSDAR